MFNLSLRKAHRILLFLLSGAFVASGAYSQRPLDLPKPVDALVSIDPATNSGSTLLHLPRETAAPVILSVGPLISKQTGRVIEAGVSFSLPNGESFEAVFKENDPPAKDRLLILKVTLSNAWEAGESEAPLFNGSTRVGTLKTIKYRFPFNVHLEPRAAGAAPISISRGEELKLILKNEDGMTYPVRWRLVIGGYESEGRLILVPNGSGTITVQPCPEWFQGWFSGLFKDNVRDGVLTISYEPEGTIANPALPSQEIPVRASIAFWREPVKAFWSTLFIFLILVCGIATSFILNYWIPNELRRLTLKEHFLGLATKTRNLSTRIGSYLRVSLRVERRRIEESLSKRMTLSPDFGDTADRAGRSLQALDQKVDLLEEIDSTYNKLSTAAASGLSPTFYALIHRKLRESEERIEKTSPQDQDVQAARALLTDAAALLQVTKIDDNTLQSLRDRFVRLWPDFNDGGSVVRANSFNAFKPYFDKLIARCREVAADQAKNITGDDYLWLDTACIKLDLAREYVNLSEARTQNCDQETERAKRLLEYLSKDTNEALEDARLLVQQMREGIFREDIEGEIAAKHITIEVEPLTVYSYEPILFRIQFRKSPLNRASALRRVSCIWNFGHDGFMERGWSTCHFFPETVKQATVTASFENSSGELIEGKDGKAVTLEKKISEVLAKKIPVGERLRIELIRTAAVLIAAMLGLLAGARTELVKVDLPAGIVAVFLLGFSADALKNLLVKK